LGKGIFTEESMKRLKVIEEVLNGKVSVIEASGILGLSYRHTLRLKKRYEQEGRPRHLSRKLCMGKEF